MARIGYFENNVSADYRRSHGIHEFLVGQQVVSVLSAERWVAFDDQLKQLPIQGGYIVTPELMTTAGISLDGIRNEKQLVGERISHVQRMSMRHADATIALGTAVIGQQAVWNGISVIQNGAIIERVNKHSLTNPESEIFEKGEMLAKRYQPEPEIQLATCSEIVGLYLNCNIRKDYPRVPQVNTLTDARTLIVSSCWSVPQYTAFDPYAPPDEERYRGQLETVVGSIFSAFQSLDHIVMADRRPEGGTIEPLNVHFARITR
jgi:hypothetical protein